MCFHTMRVFCCHFMGLTCVWPLLLLYIFASALKERDFFVRHSFRVNLLLAHIYFGYLLMATFCRSIGQIVNWWLHHRLNIRNESKSDKCRSEPYTVYIMMHEMRPTKSVHPMDIRLTTSVHTKKKCSKSHRKQWQRE